MRMNDPDMIQLSADSRALVRNAIKNAPGWRDYAERNDCDLGSLTTKEAIFTCCDELNINIADVLSAGEAIERDRAPKRVPLDNELKLEAPKTVKADKPAPVTRAPTEAAQALVDLFAGLSKAPLDREAVEAIVGERFNKALPGFIDVCNEAVNNALSRVPSIKIELKRGEDVKTIEGTHHPKFATLLKVLSACQADAHAPNVWIAGPAGSGKTYAAKTAAKALGVAFHYNGALSMAHELLGFRDAGGSYHRTPFREAFEHGGVYLFDEVDGSDNSALLALNAALANGTATFPDGQIARHPDCYVIATANTWGLGATAEYVGRAKIDAAFLSRFPVRLAWDYDAKLEQAMCGNPAWARRVQDARRRARTAGLKVLIDPRASIAGAALIAAGMTDDEAAELTYLANLSADQRRQVEG